MKLKKMKDEGGSGLADGVGGTSGHSVLFKWLPLGEMGNS